jgi:lysophospholipase L1-like esterase
VRKLTLLVTGALVVLAVSLPAAAPAGTAAAVLDVGDSLSVGTAPFLDRRLAGRDLDHRNQVGLQATEAAAIVVREDALPRVLVVSAGTNDDPRVVPVFSRAVSGILRAAGSGRCVVWPTIVRPPEGASFARLNRVLHRAAARNANLVLVDWVGMVRRHPTWLARDGVHAGAAGYRARAAAIAAAVETRCV